MSAQSETTTDILPYSYCGLLDDVVAKYTPQFGSEDFFNLTLAKSLFFGGGLYINDGYLVNHPVARTQLLTPGSLLNVMLKHGFVKIYTRMSPDQVGDMPEIMAKKEKIPTFQRLIESEEWNRPKGLREKWFEIAEHQYEREDIFQWGKARNHKIFTKLIDRVFEKKVADESGLLCTDEDLANISVSFHDRGPLTGKARTHFEDACKDILGRRVISELEFARIMQSLMTVANQAYHYGFGLSITNQFGPTAVDTTIGKAFDELLSTAPVDAYRFSSFPLFGVPASADFSDGSRFEDLVRMGTRPAVAKEKFMSNLLRGLRDEGKSQQEFLDDVQGAMIEYIDELSRMLEIPKDAFLSAKDDKSVYLVKQLGETDSSAAVGTPMAQLSVAMAAAESRSRIETLLRKLLLRDGKDQQLISIDIENVVPQATSLSLDVGLAKEFMNDESLFQD